MERQFGEKPRKVYVYATCLVDYFDPYTGYHAIQLIEQQGIEVIYIDKQTCCGQVAYSSGYIPEAKKVALSQMALFPESYPVVVLSGSCGGMMFHHYPELFKGTQYESQAVEFSYRVIEFSEFLHFVCDAKFKDLSSDVIRTAVHTSCSAQRELKTEEATSKILGQLDNITIVEHRNKKECCGFGGAFMVKHALISDAIVTDKVHSLLNEDVDTVVSADLGCLININSKSDSRAVQSLMKFEHIASFLYKRIGRL